MASIEVAPREGAACGAVPIVNDFSIQVATVNGSGSQSANTVLLRAIFQMGVPVSGKNLFPSNIAGLPTWYTIRASKDGHIARKKEIDFLVAMNPESAREDVLSLAPGAAVLYDEPLNLRQLRGDLTFYSVPFDKLAAAVCPDAKLRKLVKNMIYVGVAGWLLALDMSEVEKAIRRQFGSKPKAAELNWSAAKAGYDYAAASLTKADPFRVERMNATAGKIIIDGNAAAALGAMFGGVTVVTWYPITPSSSLVEQLIDYMKEYRIGPDGKASFAIVQAEDELAAIGMVMGASWAGARAMTATSGPGISLMSEFAGLAYYAEIPAVIWDVQRRGPSTGLPTRTAQGDLLAVAALSHGDTRHPMLFPASVAECFTMGMEAFDFAEQLQTPVFVMSDLDLAMNNWMSEPFQYPEKPMNRGKVLSREDLQRLGSFQRYKDVDGDAHHLSHACRAPIIRRRRGSRAAADTTRQASTASVRTTTCATWTAWPASSRMRARCFPGRRSSGRPGRRDGPVGWAHWRLSHWAISRALPIAAATRARVPDALRLPARPRLSVRRRSPASSSRATSGSTSWTRTATGRCCSC